MRILVLLSIIVLSYQSFPFRSVSRLGMPTAGSAKDKLQQIFNGLWEYANLTDPTQIINCFDEPTANNTVTYIGEMLKDVARQDRVSLLADTKNFVTTFPPSTLKCIVGDEEVAQLAAAYNITTQNYEQILQEIIKFVTGNLQNLSQLAGTAYFDFYQGMYKQVGGIFGQVLQQIFSSSSNVRVRNFKDSRSDLQNLLNGLFQDVQLPSPKTALQCFDETDAHITLDFYASVINDIATNNYPQLVREYEVFKGSLAKNVTQCIETNEELDAGYDAYGFNSQTPTSLLQAYAKYYIKNHAQLINTTQTINTEISDDDYFDAGVNTGNLILAILGSSPTRVEA